MLVDGGLFRAVLNPALMQQLPGLFFYLFPGIAMDDCKEVAMKPFPLSLFPGLISVLLLAAVNASATMEFYMTIEAPGSCVSPDSREGIMHRTDGQAPMRVYLSDGSSAPNFFYFIPQNSANPGTFTLKFRLENIPLEMQGSTIPDPKDFFVSGAQVGDGYPAINAYQLGTGVDDFVEFSMTIGPVPLSWGTSLYYTVSGGWYTFKTSWSAVISLTLVEPYGLADYSPPDKSGSYNDHWFRLSRMKFPDIIYEGAPFPEYMSLDSEPISGGTVSISGLNLIFEPAEAVTDSDGIFGVNAFVDPKSFSSRLPAGDAVVSARTPEERDAAALSGNLTFTYEQMIRNRNIKGTYCEVIMVEGKVTIVNGSGASLKVGDILYPGTKLSLSNGWGKKAMLGLRFINGSECQVVQDVFTNSCITDLIEIGPDGFTNLSVIQGKTPLMTMSRYLCEEIAGMPNTPAEWAKATAKFVVTTGISSVVPVPMGYETSAFVLRYVVKTASGKAIDNYILSPGDNRNKRLTDGGGAGNPRLEVRTYYNGSSRVAENVPGAFSIHAQTAATPYAGTVDGQWLELTGNGTVGRIFNQTPDSIDKEGPALRMSYEYFPAAWTTSFRLTAYDDSGVDEDTLSVLFNGSNIASSFEKKSEGVWVGEFLGPSPAYYVFDIALKDRVGNGSTLKWSWSAVPGAPANLVAEPPPMHFVAPKTALVWANPPGMKLQDVLMYEVRQWWEDGWGGWSSGEWLSVGPVNSVFMEVPESMTSWAKYYLEVRAYNQKGLSGEIARTKILQRPSRAIFGPLSLLLRK